MVCMHRSQRTGLRDLVDDALQDLAAVVDDGAVAVGEQPRARVVGADATPASSPRRADGRGHVLGVERAGDLERAQPRALGRVGLRGRRAARACRRRRSGRRRSRWRRSGRARRAWRAPRRGRRRGRRSCRSGSPAAASAIARPRSRTRTIACSAVMTWAAAAAVSSPTEWPAPTPTTPKASAGCGKSSSSGHQPGGDEQRLGDRGVADRLGVGLGAVVREVDAGARPRASSGGLEAGRARARGRGNRGSGRPVRARRWRAPLHRGASRGVASGIDARRRSSPVVGSLWRIPTSDRRSRAGVEPAERQRDAQGERPARLGRRRSR